MKRKHLSRGETLPETLIALLIVSLTFLFLTGAVVSASKINAGIKNEGVVFRRATQPPENITLSVRWEIGASSGARAVDATLHQTENGYYYYD